MPLNGTALTVLARECGIHFSGCGHVVRQCSLSVARERGQGRKRKVLGYKRTVTIMPSGQHVPAEKESTTAQRRIAIPSQVCIRILALAMGAQRRHVITLNVIAANVPKHGIYGQMQISQCAG